MTEISEKLGDRITQSVKDAPGGFLLIIACYFSVPLAAGYVPRYEVYLVKYAAFVGPLVALILYLLGDALDAAVFPREVDGKPGGWRWLAPDLAEKREEAREALKLKNGIYSLSMSLVEAAGKYRGSIIQLENESAKFLRSAVLPCCFLGCLFLAGQEWLFAGCSLGVSLILLFVYGRLKQAHMNNIYSKAIELARNSNLTLQRLENGVRLFFWKGKLISSGA